MIKFNHRGDFLTFINLADAVDCSHLISDEDYFKQAKCYYDDGQVVRHPNVSLAMSRSSISPDALMTGLFDRVVNDKKKLPEWFWHCLKRGGFMRGWGPKEYLWMGIPMLTAISLRWNLPLIPQPLWWAKKAKGYRAELAAMYVLMDIVHRGKITERHKKFMWTLQKTNYSPLVITLRRKIWDIYNPEIPILDDDRHDWGSCPGPVYRELLRFIRELKV